MESILLAFAGSLVPAVLYNVSKRNLIWCGLAGAIGWWAYAFAGERTGNYVIASFAGAFAIGTFCELISRIIKCPTVILSVSGAVPLVPGFSAYNTAKSFLENNYTLGINNMIETLSCAGAIAIGILISSAFLKNIFIKKPVNL